MTSERNPPDALHGRCAAASDLEALAPAAWIWTDNDPGAHGQIAQFRLAFPATQAACWTGFADTLYTLFCNGCVVGVGPATGIHTMPRLTAWDLGPFLRPGQENLLAIEVWFEGRRNDCCDVDTLRGGVIGWLRHDGDVIPTGGTWKARHAAGYRMPGPEGWRLFASHRLLPACEAVLQRIVKLDADGLFGSTGGAFAWRWRWAEWSLMSAEEICTWENLLAVQAWHRVADLREFLGQIGADDARGAADALGRAIVRRLWHPRHQALAQGTRTDGNLCDFCSQTDNTLALLLGILPEAQRAAALRFCAGTSGLWPTNRSGWQGGAVGQRVRHDPRLPVVVGSPGLSDLCARAIFAHQTADDGIDYIRRTYGTMLDENGGTFSECWSTPEHEAACKSQGWGGALAVTLIEEIVGLRPVEPGCGRLEWRPPACRLAFAEGRIDTPQGPVTVRWEASGALRYDVPDGVSLEIKDGSR